MLTLLDLFKGKKNPGLYKYLIYTKKQHTTLISVVKNNFSFHPNSFHLETTLLSYYNSKSQSNYQHFLEDQILAHKQYNIFTSNNKMFIFGKMSGCPLGPSALYTIIVMIIRLLHLTHNCSINNGYLHLVPIKSRVL